ncbi:hypothetical protein [Aeromicrobium wangtongii]|uniref:Uncharacterized protein n=1 Tax=Aeromicrobium wangtongii TaxID=2969247 RepID=A0ABY5M373_9ACTN|nr:hypothetical protein [Aeromicrobium wangtongii]MCD9198619.1 hypothetical protein [Aeromicrobium wangtongii]MCL3818698.1 hypothetical protein [Aeromicrobium wangtongii]UUP12645.1 hypothetical protein NQV15_12350 [Aeromicrobium wangtongii]
MSLPSDLCIGTLDTLIDRAGLKEFSGADGGPFMTLSSTMGPDPVGSVRVFTGDKVAKAVYVGIVVPQIGLDSHMVFAFMPDESPVPHFTLDSVGAGEYFAFHLDLIQRVDAGTHMVYNDWAHTPLTETYEQVNAMEGLSKAVLEPRQLTVMSSWMLASRATEEAFGQLDAPVAAYLDHWFSLVEGDVPADVVADVADTDLPTRDARNRGLLFSPEVDKVWAQISRLITEPVAEDIRKLLVNNELPG